MASAHIRLKEIGYPFRATCVIVIDKKTWVGELTSRFGRHFARNERPKPDAPATAASVKVVTFPEHGSYISVEFRTDYSEARTVLSKGERAEKQINATASYEVRFDRTNVTFEEGCDPFVQSAVSNYVESQIKPADLRHSIRRWRKADEEEIAESNAFWAKHGGMSGSPDDYYIISFKTNGVFQGHGLFTPRSYGTDGVHEKLKQALGNSRPMAVDIIYRRHKPADLAQINSELRSGQSAIRKWYARCPTGPLAPDVPMEYDVEHLPRYVVPYRTSFYDWEEFMTFVWASTVEETAAETAAAEQYRGVDFGIVQHSGISDSVTLVVRPNSSEDFSQLRKGDVVFLKYPDSIDQFNELRGEFYAVRPGVLPADCFAIKLLDKRRYDSEVESSDEAPDLRRMVELCRRKRPSAVIQTGHRKLGAISRAVEVVKRLPQISAKLCVQHCDYQAQQQYVAYEKFLRSIARDKTRVGTTTNGAGFEVSSVDTSSGMIPAYIKPLLLGKDFRSLPILDIYGTIGNAQKLDCFDLTARTRLSPSQMVCWDQARKALGGHVIINGYAGAGKSFLWQHMLLPTIFTDENDGNGVPALPPKAAVLGKAQPVPAVKLNGGSVRRIHSHLVVSATNETADDATVSLHSFLSHEAVIRGRTPLVLRRHAPEIEREIFFAIAERERRKSWNVGTQAEIWPAQVGGVSFDQARLKHDERPSAFSSDRRVTLVQFTVGYFILRLLGLVTANVSGISPTYDAAKYHWLPKDWEEIKSDACNVYNTYSSDRDLFLGHDFYDEDEETDEDRLNDVYNKLYDMVVMNASVHIGTPFTLNATKVFKSIFPNTVNVEEATRLPEQDYAALLAEYMTEARPPVFVMIGDLSQLGVYYDTPNARWEANAKTSTMARLIGAGFPYCTLMESERSVPGIIKHVSPLCYDRMLLPSKRMEGAVNHKYLDAVQQIFHGLPKGKHIIWIDAKMAPARTEGTSTFNVDSLRITQWLIVRLARHGVPLREILYICAYAAQAMYAEKMISQSLPQTFKNLENLGVLPTDPVMLNKAGTPELVQKLVGRRTFDGSQGHQADFVIVDPVQTERIGFLKDLKRCTVALTCARQVMIVLGDTESLKRGGAFRGLWSDLYSSLSRDEAVYKMDFSEVWVDDLVDIFPPEKSQRGARS